MHNLFLFFVCVCATLCISELNAANQSNTCCMVLILPVKRHTTVASSVQSNSQFTASALGTFRAPDSQPLFSCTFTRFIIICGICEQQQQKKISTLAMYGVLGGCILRIKVNIYEV